MVARTPYDVDDMTLPTRRVVAFVAIGVAAGTFTAWWSAEPDPVPIPPQEALVIPVPSGHEIADMAIDPDGTMLAYTAVVDRRMRLILRRFDPVTEETVPGTHGASQPFFAPDGERVAYFAGGLLMTARVDGSRPIEVCAVASATAGGTWTADGRIIFAPLGGQGLVSVPADGGIPAALTQLDEGGAEVAHGWPHALPDGRSLVFTIGRAGRSPLLALLSLETGERRSLVPAEGGASYATSGHVLYARRGEAFALPIDAETLSVRGAPRVVTAGAASSAAGYERLGRSSLVAARDGTLVYAPTDEGAADTTLVWVDRQGEVTPLDGVVAPHFTPRVSPDGKQIIAASRTDPFSRDLWLVDLGTHHRQRLTEDAGDNHSPIWSPDGRRVVFASSRDGPQRIYSMPTTGDATPDTLLFGDGRTPGSWSQDGRTLFFHETHTTQARDIWMWSTDDAESSRLIITRANERAPAVSPDSKWLAFVSDDEAGDQIYVQPHPDNGGRRRVSAIGGTEPVWAHNGLELFYRRGPEVHVVAFDSATGVVTSAARLFDGGFATDPDGNVPTYDVSPDGSRLLMLRPAARVDVLRLLRYWAPVVFAANGGR